MEKDFIVGEVLPQQTVEQLGKLFYRLGGAALSAEIVDRMIDNPNIVLGEE